MLILSKHRDYYDSVLRHGVDKTIVYNRARHEVELKMREVGSTLPEFFKYHMQMQDYTANDDIQKNLIEKYKIIPFAITGKLVLVVFDTKGMPVQDLRQAIKTKDFLDYQKSREVYWRNGVSDEDMKKRIQIIDRYDGADISEFCIQHRIVVARLYSKKTDDFKTPTWHRCNALVVEHNPPLIHYNLQKKIDPFTISQNISMWISGVIGSPSMPMPVMDDKVMVASKGFDERYGFRTRPKTK